MTPDPQDGLTVEYTPAKGPRRRVRYEPRSDGTYARITERWTGCDWFTEGREPVSDLVVEDGSVILP